MKSKKISLELLSEAYGIPKAKIMKILDAQPDQNGDYDRKTAINTLQIFILAKFALCN
jgi:hypothetical protein